MWMRKDRLPTCTWRVPGVPGSQGAGVGEGVAVAPEEHAASRSAQISSDTFFTGLSLAHEGDVCGCLADVAHLVMFVNRLPGLRVGELSRANAGELVQLVADMERRFFGQSQTNPPEVLGTLAAPELHGTRGTAGVWQDGRLVAALLAYDALEHEQTLALDLFASPCSRRAEIVRRLLAGARAYGASRGPRIGDWLKVETFGGDDELAAAVADDGYRQHRVYLRMRLDFDRDGEPAVLPAGFTTRVMTTADWPAIHTVITAAFRDHYDFHPLPLDLVQQQYDTETTDYSRWQLVFQGSELVGLGIASNRYAEQGLGYVDTLAVLREARGRGIATFLLRHAFEGDRARGLRGTALHCDATNPTGAARLYEAVGMRRDQHYDAWRARLL